MQFRTKERRKLTRGRRPDACKSGRPAPSTQQAVRTVRPCARCGRQVHVGGSLPAAQEGGGQFYPPTVLTGVTPGMRIWAEEVFGPVIVVVRGA